LPPGGLSLLDLEKRVITRVLELKEGNVTQAAAYLGIPRHVLAYRMSKYGIERRETPS
jgi:two-component system NtrC family response regulator